MAKYFLDNIVKRYLIRRELDGMFLGSWNRHLPATAPAWKLWSWSHRGTKQYRDLFHAINMAKRLATMRDRHNLDWGILTIVEETWEITNIESLGVDYNF